MNKQEIFDKCLKRLRDGTGRAVVGNLGCAYKTPEGLKCNVGIFIPENRPDMQTFCGGVRVFAEYFENTPFVQEFIQPNLELLSSLQRAHDRDYHWNGKKFNDTGEFCMEEIARHYRLTYTLPNLETS